MDTRGSAWRKGRVKRSAGLTLWGTEDSGVIAGVEPGAGVKPGAGVDEGTGTRDENSETEATLEFTARASPLAVGEAEMSVVAGRGITEGSLRVKAGESEDELSVREGRTLTAAAPTLV